MSNDLFEVSQSILIKNILSIINMTSFFKSNIFNPYNLNIFKFLAFFTYFKSLNSVYSILLTFFTILYSLIHDLYAFFHEKKPNLIFLLFIKRRNVCSVIGYTLIEFVTSIIFCFYGACYKPKNYGFV
jgi:hypothetical protein